MNANISAVNLKVLVMDTDYYALQAINSYLAWDRRTRVTFLAETPESMWDCLSKTAAAELPDVVLLDAPHVGGADALSRTINRLSQRIPNVKVLCMGQTADTTLVEAAAAAGARGFLLKGEVRSQIAWAIVYALEHDFVVTQGIAKLTGQMFNSRVFHATALPRQREYPELTDRIRQAIELCVVKGMPAHLAADEMGISLHTIRSYIKEGYRILEAYDETEYPHDMSPQERAFMRITSFSDKEE
jgi:two-component system NarL family response regulator